MTEPAPRSTSAGKYIVIGIVSALVLTMAGIGHHHATRNRIRHAPGSLTGKQLYELYCDRCHGANLKGDANYPNLLARPYSLEEQAKIIKDGGKIMPKFPFLDGTDAQRIHEYVAERRDAQNR